MSVGIRVRPENKRAPAADDERPSGALVRDLCD